MAGLLVGCLLVAGCGGGSSNAGGSGSTSGSTSARRPAPRPPDHRHRGPRAGGGRDPQDPARRDHHAGEPLVRLLLRHLPRRRRHPGLDGNPRPRCCLPDPQQRGLRAALPRPDDRSLRRPALRAAAAQVDINGGKMDGFVGEQERGMAGCAADVQPGLRQRASGTPDVMGYHDAREIPNYWAYAHHFVLQDHMFEPDASWSLPAHLFMVSAWSADCCARRATRRSCGSAIETPADPPDFSRKLGVALPTTELRLDRPHLPPAQGRRELGLLRGRGHRARLRRRRAMSCAPIRRRATDARHLEPAAVLHRRPAGRPARQHPVARRTSSPTAERGTLPAVSWVDPERTGQRAPARADQRRPDLRDRPDQRDHAEPRLEQHRDLPGLGRLGRLLRPRRAAVRRRRTATACASPAW